jgi:hypothetical protein
MAEDCRWALNFERLYWRKLPFKSSTPESPIAVIQNLNVIGCKVPYIAVIEDQLNQPLHWEDLLEKWFEFWY